MTEVFYEMTILIHPLGLVADQIVNKTNMLEYEQWLGKIYLIFLTKKYLVDLIVRV